MNLETRVKNEEAFKQAEENGDIILAHPHQYPLFDISTEYMAHLDKFKNDFMKHAFHEYGHVSEHFKQIYYGVEASYNNSRFDDGI